MDAAKSKHQIAGLYDLQDTIGEGHYAVVKLAKHVFTGETVAVKVIDKMKLDAATRVQMLQEVQLMKLVQHPHVVRLYEVIDTQTKLYLILEYADGGDMYDYIMKHEGGLDEEQARKYFRQIVTAIQYCHRLHVVHRDLKPENVVFFERLGIVKLTDFGFSNQFNPGQHLQTSCGSLAYSAPEILLGDAYDAPAVDIWSLGVILYMLVCGAAPFQEANDSETLTMIMDCKYTFPKHISQNCRSLISRMLQRQPETRATLDDIVNDPWVGGSRDPEGNAVPVDEQLPLVSRKHLSEEDHEFILKKMVSGQIATVEDIILALDMNEYNHITATYFLLAERKLRSERHEIARQMKLQKASQKSHSASSPAVLKMGTSKTLEEITRGGRIVRLDEVGTEARTLTTQELAEVHSSSYEDPESKKAFGRIRNISMVTEEEEEESEIQEEISPESPGADLVEEVEEDEEDVVIRPIDPLQRTFSRHSSTSSLADKLISGCPSAASANATIVDVATLTAGLRLGMVAGRSCDLPEDEPATPAPFPVTSHIGMSVLSRQGSLRKSEGSAAVSPASERKSVPSSPSTPPGSNVSSTQGSPARYKIKGNKKLVSQRSSPQLLNQIYEEEGEECGTGGQKRDKKECENPGVDPVDAFPGSAAGAAVLRRLEQRRRLHKSRTQSCSSSDASDDDSESRRKRHDKSRTPPYKRDSQHDDSSDSQDPGVGAMTSSSKTFGASIKHHQSVESSSKESGNKTSGNSSGGNGNQQRGPGRRHRTLHHSSAARIRQSHSLNRISELHVADFSSEDVSNNNSSCPSSVASIVNGVQYPKQPLLTLENDSNGAPFDMLSRYLESISNRSNNNHNNGAGGNRNRDDSQNSSDGENEDGNSTVTSRRRHKVNLRVLEQRLNKIQEENNKSADEEEGEVEDEAGELSDDPSTLPEEDEEDDHLKSSKKEEIEEARDQIPTTLLKIYDPKRFASDLFKNDDRDETMSSKSVDVNRHNHLNSSYLYPNKPRRPLHRAHSCGSLMSLKERAILSKRLPLLWDILNDSGGHEVANEGTAEVAKDFALRIVTNPLAVLRLQEASKCCNLC